MADIKGTNIASPVAPFTTDDAYPTHYAKYGNGGYKEVATTADRDAIPLSRLEEGCVVYVKANNTEYRWIDNTWEEISIDLAEYVKKDENGNVDITGKLTVNGKLDVKDVLKAEKGEYNSIISLGNNTIGEQDEPDSWEEDGETVYEDAYATVVLGDNNESHNSVVLGNYNKTKGFTSVIGNYNDLSQGYGWVFGANNKITNNKSLNVIFGNNNETAWAGALMIGNYNKQLSTGSASYNADAGITIGRNNISKGKNSLIIGSYSQEDSTANRIIIANGTSNTNRHNVITIDSNNAVNIDGSLTINNEQVNAIPLVKGTGELSVRTDFYANQAQGKQSTSFGGYGNVTGTYSTALGGVLVYLGITGPANTKTFTINDEDNVFRGDLDRMSAFLLGNSMFRQSTKENCGTIVSTAIVNGEVQITLDRAPFDVAKNKALYIFPASFVTGDGSFSSGFNTVKGYCSQGLGYGNVVLGNQSSVFGYGNYNAAVAGTAAMYGSHNESYRGTTFTAGQFNINDGVASTVLGAYNKTSNSAAFATGGFAHAKGAGSVALGALWTAQFKVSGAANATTYTITQLDADTTADELKYYVGTIVTEINGAAIKQTLGKIPYVVSVDSTNKTFTTNTTLSKTALTNASVSLAGTIAYGDYSFAMRGIAGGLSSFVANRGNKALGSHSAAFGNQNTVNNTNEFATGQFNLSHTGTAFSIGNGTGNSNRSNLVEIMQNGDTYVGGNLFLGKYGESSNIDIRSLVSSSGLVPMIYTIKTSDCTITSDTTKGVAPYSTSYGYTNIEINKNSGIKWVEGAIYIFNLTATIGASATRNGRIRIGGDSDGDTWHPLMNASGSILACHSHLTKGTNYMWTYKTTYQTGGALHMLTDSNTTYDYLINYGYWTTSTACPRYTLCFMTTPFESTTPTIGALVTTSSTGASKAVNSGKFYAYDYPYYNNAGTYDAGTTPTMIQGYGGLDLRYTANTSSTYVTTNQRVFLHLNDYDPEDKSFTATNAVGSICSLDKLATKFPAGTAGRYVYLYLLGHTTTTWYTLRPEYDMSVGRIYRYDSTEGTLEDFTNAVKSISGTWMTQKDIIADLQKTVSKLLTYHGGMTWG